MFTDLIQYSGKGGDLRINQPHPFACAPLCGRPGAGAQEAQPVTRNILSDPHKAHSRDQVLN